MKTLDESPQPLHVVGAFVGAHWVLLLVLLLVLVLVTAIVLFAILRPQKPSPAKGPGVSPGATRLPTGHLRAAWQRFSQRLPHSYSRSILNFEHFIVLGAAASGKSQLIDDHTAWQRQTKEFASSQPNDPDLPVYLASTEVVQELPAHVLDDHSDATFRALNRLWRPIFRKRGPTVVAVVDAMRLKDGLPEVVRDLAQKMRGKVNVLTTIRGRPIEVRVALTHLDAIEGWAELAAFCRDHEIPLRLWSEGDRGTWGVRLDAWLDELRGYLPNALTAVSAPEYRRIVQFMSRLPDVVDAMKPFLKELFFHEVSIPDPIFGGVYLASRPPGIANPLFGALERGPGPDPQRRHATVSAAAAVGLGAYMLLAFQSQYAAWATASDAFDRYNPNDASEAFYRSSVTAFTSRSKGWLEQHPDFLGHLRSDMRAKFSKRIRDHFLIPRLREVAKKGTLRDDGIPMAARRAIYYLGVIHSDKADRLQILADERPRIWGSMLELTTDSSFVEDYLRNTDEALRTPVEFDLPAQGVDPKDDSKVWIDFLDRLRDVLQDGVVTRVELAGLRQQTVVLGPLLKRFEYDTVMTHVAESLDTAAGTEVYRDGVRETPGQLESFYRSKYEAFLLKAKWATEDDSLVPGLAHIIALINASSIEAARPQTLEELVTRLEELYEKHADAHEGQRVVRIKIGGQDKELPAVEWADLLRDSTADEYIGRFLRGGLEQDVLFSSDLDRSLPPVIWNAPGDMASIFVGRGVLRGRFTRAAYDKHVREVVQRLTRVLDKGKINREVKEQIGRYATSYREELMRFSQSFDVEARSAEELRVALAQMASDSSAFNDFLVAVNRNSRLEVEESRILEPMRGVTGEFASWNRVVDGAGSAPEVAKYRAMLAQLLVDLAGSSSAANGSPVAAAAATAPNPELAAAGPALAQLVALPSPPPSGDPGAETLEKAVGPVGRRYLSDLRGDTGSYAVMVDKWLFSVSLPEYQRKAFRAPFRRLAEIGRADVDKVLWRVWQLDMLPSIVRIAERFPFDPTAKEEATPLSVTEVLHPLQGRFFDNVRRYVDPLCSFGDKTPFHPRAAVVHGLSLPPNMFPVINAAASLSSKLWDPGGNPTPLEIKVGTVSFERDLLPRKDGDSKSALTLMYFNVGESSVYNFNQKPSLVTIAFEWTKDQRAQVGVQLTDVISKENSFPQPIVSNGTYWSFYHLLLQGEVSAVKSPTTARLYTWRIQYQPDAAGTEVIPVRFTTLTDPWEPFVALGRYGVKYKGKEKEAR
jgi:hypothetical protein